MSTYEPARLSLRSRMPLEIRVYDSDGHVVGRGFGTFNNDQMVPGIYQIELRAGATSQQTLVRLAPGQNYERTDISVAMSSAAPLPSTNNYHENHFYAAQALSKQATLSYAPDACRILLFARAVNVSNLLAGDRAFRWWLFDSDYNEIPNVDGATTWNPSAGCGGVSVSLNPGGYILRVHNQGDRDAVDQPIWAVNGWQTMVFLPTSNSAPSASPRSLVRMQAASIHMAQLGDGWQPGYDDASVNLALAVEMCLPGLQAGRSLVPRDQLLRMLNAKFQNPMFGIIGAYCMCLSWAGKSLSSNKGTRDDDAQRDPDLLRTVLNNLELMLGSDHPDLVGVKFAAPRDLYDGPLPNHVVWPPMIAQGYQELVAAVGEEESVEPESLAEVAAGWLDPNGPWTQWSSRFSETWRRSRGQSAISADPESAISIKRPLGSALMPTDFLTNVNSETAGEELSVEPLPDDLEVAMRSAAGDIESVTEEVSSDAPEVVNLEEMVEQRVRGYLRELKEQNEESDPRALQAQVVRLSSGMALPVRSVRRALNRVITNLGDVKSV